jgi:cyanophycinase
MSKRKDTKSMNDWNGGALVVIGGHEAKSPDDDRVILSAVVERTRRRDGPLLVITAATQLPDEVGQEYIGVFRDLGLDNVEQLDVRTREDANAEACETRVRAASALFFTGGDQLRITSQIGGTRFYDAMLAAFRDGLTIAGTSAGAAAISDTMVVSGSGEESFTAYGIEMAAGLGLLSGVIIDSHFAERGRIGRLLGCVAENPKNLGIGIDENTAIVVEPDRTLCVLGTGAIYIVDGSDISYTNVSEERAGRAVTIRDVRLHVLAHGDRYSLDDRVRHPHTHS